MEKENNFFENRIKPIFTWVGSICALLLAGTYIFVASLLVNGTMVALGTQQIVMYAILNGIMTFSILIALMIQGQDFAKISAADTIKRLNDLKPKKVKRIHSMTYYWLTEIPKKLILKAGWAWFSTLAVTTIFIQGSGDMSLVWMAILNCVLSFGTGLLGITKTYDYYMNNQVPNMEKQINELLGSEKEPVKEVQDDSL